MLLTTFLSILISYEKTWFDDEIYVSVKYISLIVKNKIDGLFARNKILSHRI